MKYTYISLQKDDADHALLCILYEYYSCNMEFDNFVACLFHLYQFEFSLDRVFIHKFALFL